MCAARDRKPGFDSEFTGTVLKVKLRGEIDHHSAVAVRTNIDDMIRSKRPAELIIDMSAVDFMDSSGLGLIMGRFNTMKEIGGSVTVADPNAGIERIMSLAGLERIVRVVHTGKSKRQETSEIRESAAVMKSRGFFDDGGESSRSKSLRKKKKEGKNR